MYIISFTNATESLEEKDREIKGLHSSFSFQLTEKEKKIMELTEKLKGNFNY